MKRALTFAFLMSLAIVAGCGGGGGGGGTGGPPPTLPPSGSPTPSPTPTVAPTAPPTTAVKTVAQQSMQVLQLGSLLTTGFAAGNYNQLIKSLMVRRAQSLRNQGAAGRHTMDSQPPPFPPNAGTCSNGTEYTQDQTSGWIFIYTFYDANCTNIFEVFEINEQLVNSTTFSFAMVQEVFTPGSGQSPTNAPLSYTSSTGYIVISSGNNPVLLNLQQQVQQKTGPAASGFFAEDGINMSFDGTTGATTAVNIAAIANNTADNSSSGISSNFPTFQITPVSNPAGTNFNIQGTVTGYYSNVLGAITMSAPDYTTNTFPVLSGGTAGPATTISENMTYSPTGLPISGSETITDPTDNTVVQISIVPDPNNGNPDYSGLLSFYTTNAAYAGFLLDATGNGKLWFLPDPPGPEYHVYNWTVN